VRHSIRESSQASELGIDMKRVYIARQRRERVEVARSHSPIQFSSQSNRQILKCDVRHARLRRIGRAQCRGQRLGYCSEEANGCTRGLSSTTNEPGGTLLRITTPAAIMEFSPIVTPARTIEYAPSQTPRSIRIGFAILA